MSLINNLKHNCYNCLNQDKMGSPTVAYRCSKCRFINCLMCNKTHDNACDVFYKNEENVSKVTAGSKKSTTVPSINKLKRSLNIKKLDVDKNLLIVSSIDNSESVSRKRQYTTVHGSIKSRDKANKNVPASKLKCNTCESFFTTKGSLTRHMKSNKHAAKIESLNDALSETSTSLPRIKLDRIFSAETVFNDYCL